MLAVIVLACKNGLEGDCRVGTRDAIVVVARVGELQIQGSIYFGVGKEKTMGGEALEYEEVFPVHLQGLQLEQQVEGSDEHTCPMICCCVSKGRSTNVNRP